LSLINTPSRRTRHENLGLEVLDMTGSIVVLLVILAAVALLAIVGTVVLVVRDGRGLIPPEKSDRPWTAGNLPSLPYSQIRF
ncbi:hypothetical protein, partial [Arthrobacter sp. AL12]|uniref:hypothetical protein n=1 Tax=Arthrobacter sp. AL12 TaxID=3042241 RepID=UPI00249AEE3A